MKVNILTLFPELFEAFKSQSIIGRAVKNGLLEINIINIRDFCFDKHQQACLLYTSPQGIRFDQQVALALKEEEEITIIAGHYEGIDERVVEEKVDMEISIGDFVLTGGELPSMVMVDAVARLIPGVITKASYENDSFFNGLLDYPQYTRPAEYMGLKVPDVLLSGNHKNIREWRKKESLKRTYLRRPDLLEGREFSKEEMKFMREIKAELEAKNKEEEKDDI